jgi:hypothetical protein
VTVRSREFTERSPTRHGVVAAAVYAVVFEY